MSFEGPDVDNYGGDEDGHRKRDTSRKRDGKKDKKEKGYTMFEEEDSDGDSLVLADDLKSPSKAKGSKAKPFKFPVRKEKAKEKEEKKDKEAKKEEKEKRREEKEGKKLKKEKKKSKLHEPAVTIAAPGDYDNPIFGVPLALAVERNKSHDGIELPAIVRECVDYIEECGLACEGIYRMSGVKSKVQALKDSYNRHQPIYLYEHEPNIVASLLKQFLRDLPEPVLTTAFMPRFEEASTFKSNKKKVELFSKIIAELPVCNRLLLSWMIVHMSHVIDLVKENKMTLENVSIVLSPTMRISHRVLNVLFSNSQALFGDVQLRKYVPPLRPAHSKWSLELPDNLTSLEEELAKQESLLNQLHTDLNSGLTDPVIEEQLWEVQRVVTQLKRKIKLAKKGSEKGEGARPTVDPKRSSNSSLPSLSAPEELHLDLKPVPIPKATSSSPPSATVTAAVVETQPEPKAEGTKEKTVTLETSKTVKFVEKPETESKSKTKPETEEADKDKKEDAKVEGEKTIVKDADGKDKDSSKEEKTELKDEVKTEEGKEITKQKEQEVKVESEKKEGSEERAKNEAVGDDGKAEEKDKGDNDESVKTVVAAPSKIEAKAEEKVEKDNESESVSNPASNHDGEKRQERSDVVKTEEINEKKPEKSHEEPKVKVTLRNQEEKEEEKKEEKKETKRIPSPPSHQSNSTNRKSVPVPPFMSLTLLEPVKAEIPTRKKSGSESTEDLENQRKSEEEWRELEEELLGKKKEKEKKKKKSREVPDEEVEVPESVNTEQMLEEEYSLVMEEEELLAIADELRQKMATERSEMERLAQEIQELHYLRQDSDLEDMSSESNSSDESEDEEDLQDLLVQLIQDNQDLETQNAEMCQKIHEERMICLSVKLQIRLLQQKQLEASCG